MTDNIIAVECGESITIAQVGEFYPQLLAGLAEEQAISVDISQVSRIDTAAMQLLYNFNKNAQIQDKVVIWSEPTKVFQDVADILGMDIFYVTES